MSSKFSELFVLFFILSAISTARAQESNPPMNHNEIFLKDPSVGHSSGLGPFELTSADSSSSIQLQFVGQLWMWYENFDNGSGKGRTKNLLMKARRIRLSLSGTIHKPELSYRLHLSMAPKSLELMDFYFNYKVCNNIQFRFGQYKTPFTRYRIQSFQRLVFIDWSIVTKYFGAERQMGLALHNGFEKPPKLGYVFGVFSGVNARASHGIGLSLAYNEKAPNPSDLAGTGTPASFHPELFFHLTYNANDIRIQSNSDAENGGFRYSIGASAAWDIDPTPYHDFGLRLAPECLIKYKGISFLAAGYAGFSDLGVQSEMKLAMTGGLLQSSYRINKTYEVAVRYSVVNFEDALMSDAQSRANRLIADSENDPDVIAQYQSAGQIDREQEAVLGFNVYFIDHFLKWQNDIGWLGHSLKIENKDDYLARSQFQLSF